MNRHFYVAALLLATTFICTIPMQAQDFNGKSFKELSPEQRHEIGRKWYDQLRKALQADERHDDLKQVIVDGNQIRVLITNQGSISTPVADNSLADLFWPKGNGLGYSYEFGPLVAAEVVNDNGDTLHIVNDGFFSCADADCEPGTQNTWGWEPKLGFSDPNSNEVATFSDLDDDLDGKPDSWPENFFNEVLGRYVWPAFLGDDATTPDEEVFYVMDDFDNAEFDYVPDPNNPEMKGLGLELQVRIFQFNNPLAEDLIFLVYTVTNVSAKTLEKVYLGMFGDPHVGGPNDFSDDNASFISAFDESFPFNTRNMLYAFDQDGIGDGGKPTGYFGYRFLESPGIDDDGIDNDNDGLLDESQFNDAGSFIFGPIGIYGADKLHWSGDEDGDWEAEFDDVGVDGIAGTGDIGEGDGKPTQLFFLDLNGDGILNPGEPTSETRLPNMRFGGGEPNFGFLDTAESDQLGLTSFNGLLFGGDRRPWNDPLMWQLMSTPNQRPGDPPPVIEQEADNVFIYSSGPFRLEPGESQRFSIALLLGQDLLDLLQNAETSQQVFESDYRFAKAPNKPILTAVPGDGKVTLFWDTGAESSFDPFIARANPDSAQKGFDFEGYKIYRSQDFSLNDTQTITDSRGNPFLSVPLRGINGVPAQFDLVNQFSGLSDIEYQGRGVRFDLGTNTGLVHSYVDSNNVKNGISYFYAVTSYDHGDENSQIAPTESQRTIKRDPVTREFTFDVNTARVIPGPPASGFVDAEIEGSLDNLAFQDVGNATGSVRVEFFDPFSVKDGKKYELTFADVQVAPNTTRIGYSVVDLRPLVKHFTARDTFFVNLLTRNIVPGSETVRDQSGNVVDASQYKLDHEDGRIRGSSPGSLAEGQQFEISFNFKPVANSTGTNGEDDNPVFDGMRVLVQDEESGLDPLSIDGGRSGFKVIATNTNFTEQTIQISQARVGNPASFPSDFEIRFVDYDTTSSGDLVTAPDTSIISNVAVPFRIIDVATEQPVVFFISEPERQFRNGRWDYRETIVLIRPDAQQVTDTMYEINFARVKKVDGSADSLVTFDELRYPGDGDIFLFFSRKPFEPGDQYSFTTKAVTFNNQLARSALDNIHVVPNPYVGFSANELSFRPGVRDDKRIEFRGLPEECTIRIYTITGDLITTIKKEKGDFRDFAVWDLLTFEAQKTAYGVYIYHVDAPGIGTKIGRLALIK